MRLLRFLGQLVLCWDLERSHILMACGFGLYLWIAQSFRGTTVPGLRAMSDLAERVAPAVDAEALWGSLMIGSGLLALLGLLTRQQRVRQISAAALAVVWWLMAACFWTANPHSPGGLTWVVFGWAAFARVFQHGTASA